jgi:hypothetical protein
VQKQKQKQKQKQDRENTLCVESIGDVSIQIDGNYCAFLIFSIFGIECMVA